MKFSCYVCLFSLLSLFSCDLFDYHLLDGKVDNKPFCPNDYNWSKIQNLFELKDSVTFAFIGDTHRDDSKTKDFVQHINSRKDIDFIIHAGDITDFGTKDEYEWTRGILSKLDHPYVVLLGNHDIRGRGDEVYRQMYREENFSFVVQKTKFLCLNTNMLEYKNPVNIPDFDYIEHELHKVLTFDPDLPNNTEVKSTVVVMHSPPEGEQFYDEEKIERFHKTIKKFPNLRFCLHGHTHKYDESIHDGITYYGCDNIAKRTYLRFTLTKESHTYELVKF